MSCNHVAYPMRAALTLLRAEGFHSVLRVQGAMDCNSIGFGTNGPDQVQPGFLQKRIHTSLGALLVSSGLSV